MSRLHLEGVYCMIACDVCEGHGPRVRVSGKEGPTAEDEAKAHALCERWEPSLWRLFWVRVRRIGRR
jgi:hypothetical protein